MGSYNSINFTKLIVNSIPYNKAYMGSKILFENNNPFTLEITGYKDGNSSASLYYRKGSNTQENCTFYITCGNTTYTKRSTNTTGTYLTDDNNNRIYFYSGDKIKIKVVYDNNDTPVVGTYGAGITLAGCYFKVYGDLTTYNANGYYESLLSASNAVSGGDGLTDISGIMWPDSVSAYCYRNMFYNQVNLTQAIDLPATTLAFRCYTNMLYHTGVTDITMHALDYSPLDAASVSPGGFNQFQMTVTQPTNGGVFRLPAGNNLAQFSSIEGKAPDASDQKWSIQSIDYSKKYFTIQSLEDNNTITFTKYNQNGLRVMADKPIQYSKDLTTWNNISFVTDNSSQIVLNSGEKLYLKGTNSAYGELVGSFYMSAANIQTSENIDFMGNIMSLIYGDNFENNSTISTIRTFTNLFRNNNKLTNAKDLVLPTTSLTTGCYQQMFYGCTSLTVAPELPATTLVNSCYDSMFRGCTSLNYVKAMFTTTPSSSYTSNWVSGVSSTGTFVKNSSATWDVTGVNGVPSGWTVTTASA